MKLNLFCGVLVLCQAVIASGQTVHPQDVSNQPVIQPVSNTIPGVFSDEGDEAAASSSCCDAVGCASRGCCDSGCCNSGCCGKRFIWGEDTWLTVGAGIRASYNAIEGGNPANGGTAQDFNINNARLYFNGKGHERIGFEFNTDINNAQPFDGVPGGFPTFMTGEMRILDAIVKFQISDNIHLWTGRFLPPSDRSNLSGPFFLNAWNFPFTQFGFPNIFQGRDDGAALWGEYGGGLFKWALGAFEGESHGGPITLGQPGTDNLMFTGRVVLNLLDPEPGYYNASTYYGAKDILAIGATLMHRSSNTDLPGPAMADYTGWNIDGLFETTLPNRGVVTLEGAYYNFDDNNGLVGGMPVTLPSSATTGGNRQGQSYFMLGSYMFPRRFCMLNVPGRFQVMGRYQNYERETIGAFAGGTDDQVDLQLNYIMFSHNARISAVWSQLDTPAAADLDTFTIGTQVQF